MLAINISNIFINETNNKHVFITGCLCLACKETRTLQILKCTVKISHDCSYMYFLVYLDHH